MPMHFLSSFSAVFALTGLALQTVVFAQQCVNQSDTPSTPTNQFSVHGNGTVTHNATGLMWKVCSEGKTWSGSPSGMAACSGASTAFNFDTALPYAQNHSFAGHNDWRMPSVQELLSIVETCRGSPINNKINEVIFPATSSDAFLTGSVNASEPSLVWSVFFANGSTDNSGSRTFVGLNQARLVRGTPAPALGFLASGACGASANTPRTAAPTVGLCADASLPTVTATANSFQWQCAGAANLLNSQSGVSASCSAPRQYTVTASPNPAHSGGRLDCAVSAGGALGATTVVDFNATVQCTAAPNAHAHIAKITGCGGTQTEFGVSSFVTAAVIADCTVTAQFVQLPANGACGSAQNAFSATAPTVNLCASTAGNSAVTQVGTQWNWSCSPMNGGVAAQCSSPATTCTMDIDGDGFVNTQIDALIHARVAAGMVGPDVLNGFTIPLDAARRDWASIRNHLVNRCGMSLP